MAEDLDEVRMSQDVEAPREGGLAHVLVVRLVELVGVPLLVDLLVVGVIHLLVAHPVHAPDDVVVGERRREAVHLLLFTGDEVYLYPQPQLHVLNLLPRLLEGGEVYVVEVAVVLGDAHLADAALSGDLAVSEDVLDRHRSVAVGDDVQVVVDQRSPGVPYTICNTGLYPSAFVRGAETVGYHGGGIPTLSIECDSFY